MFFLEWTLEDSKLNMWFALYCTLDATDLVVLKF